MYNYSKFPTSDGDFNKYVNDSGSLFNTDTVRLVTTPAGKVALDALNGLLNAPKTGWNTLYPLTLSKATSNTELVRDRNDSRENIEAELVILINDIPSTLLTSHDKTILGLIDTVVTHNTAARPTSIPSIIITKHNHLSIEFRIEDTATKANITNLNDAVQVNIESAFLPISATAPAGYPQNNDFHHVAISGKSKATISFELDQVKGTVTIRACYLNGRGEAGPWSEFASTTVI